MQRHSIHHVTAGGTALSLLPDAAWALGPSDTDRYTYGPRMMVWDGGWYGMVFGPLFMILALPPVLAAMGVPERIGIGAVRFSLGRQTRDAEIDAVVTQPATVPAVSA